MSIQYNKPRATIASSGVNDNLQFLASSGIDYTMSLGELKKTGLQVFNVRQYGAVGNGVADDSAAIQAAIDAATAASGVVVAHGTFKLNSPIYITTHMYAGDAIFKCTGTNANSIIIQANKTPNTTAIITGKTIELPTIQNSTKPGVGWAGQQTGVLIRNLDNCVLHAREISNFNVGLYVSAYSAGTVYNRIYLGRIVNNVTNVLLKTDNNLGWVNQNTFYGGRLGAFESGTNTFLNLNVFGFGNPTDFTCPNTNTFIGLSVEGEGDGNGPQHHIKIAGVSNVFINTRLEVSSGTPKIQYVGDTSGANLTRSNLFLGGYSIGNIAWSEANMPSTYNEVIGFGWDPARRSGAPASLVNNRAGNDLTRVFKSTKNMTTASGGSPDWTVAHTEDGFDIKPSGTEFPAIRLATNYLQMGDGSVSIAGMPYMSYHGVVGTQFSQGLKLGGYFNLTEQATPGNAPANNCYIYAKDNGSGKTQLMVRFSTGAEQQIAIEP